MDYKLFLKNERLFWAMGLSGESVQTISWHTPFLSLYSVFDWDPVLVYAGSESSDL